jgi:outer membrane protein OmpA-like peptidoglycan-associated protein
MISPTDTSSSASTGNGPSSSNNNTANSGSSSAGNIGNDNAAGNTQSNSVYSNSGSAAESDDLNGSGSTENTSDDINSSSNSSSTTASADSSTGTAARDNSSTENTQAKSSTPGDESVTVNTDSNQDNSSATTDDDAGIFSDKLEPSTQDLMAIEAALNATEVSLLGSAISSPELPISASSESPVSKNEVSSGNDIGTYFSTENTPFALSMATNEATIERHGNADSPSSSESIAENFTSTTKQECSNQSGANDNSCCPREEITQLAGVNFETDKAELTSESRSILDQTAKNLARCGDQRFEIGGHTDARASESYNLRLSQARAEAVRSYLIDKGVKPSRLSARGYGESQPLNANMNEDQLEKNRRVELRHLK